MSYVFTAPDALAAAATDVDGIASALSAANAAAAGRTSGVLAAAEDEVSQAIAQLFGAYGQEYQQVLQQAAAFHGEFTQALGAASTAYSQAEAANVSFLNAGVSNAAAAINAPMQSLLGAAGTGGPASSAATVALIMGGTNNPLPDMDYIKNINKIFIQQLFPGAVSKGIFTPEQFWPVTGSLGTFTFGQSIAQGLTLLQADVAQQLAIPGNNVVVFGYSQSATIVNNYINSLIAQGSPNVDRLSFVQIGDPNNPNGGILRGSPGSTSRPWMCCSTVRSRARPTTPPSTPLSTTASPTPRNTRSMSCRTSTPSWATSSYTASTRI